MQTRKQIFKSAFLGVLSLLLLNFPFISIPDKIALALSIPVLYVYTFGLWLALIIALFFVIDIPGVFKQKKHE